MRPRAEMSLTWICPLEGPLVPFDELEMERDAGCEEEPFVEVEFLVDADADLARPDGG